LGPGGKGILSYALTLLVFALTIADGIRAAIAYQIGTEGEPERRVFGAALKVVGLLGVAGAAIFVGLIAVGPNRAVYPLVAVAFPIALLVNSAMGFYFVRHRVEITNAIILAVSVVSSVGGALAVWLLHDPVSVIAVMALADAVAAAYVMVGLRRLLGGGPIFGTPGLFERHLRFASHSAVASTLAFLALRVDVFIVSAKLSAALLGIYTLALGSGELMWQISRAAGTSAYGRIATAARPESAALTARLTRTILFIEFVVAVILFVFGPWLIELVYGAPFAEAGAVMRIALPGLVLYGGLTILAYFFSVKEGMPGFVVRIQLVSLVICVGVTLATIGRFGIYGAAAANTVAYTIAFAFTAVTFVRRTGVRPAELLVLRRGDLIAAWSTVRARLRPSRTAA
ncbi:MAG: oligosaccharide flippase family protein, partial [Vulcanimicrobiaceae bacterium]